MDIQEFISNNESDDPTPLSKEDADKIVEDFAQEGGVPDQFVVNPLLAAEIDELLEEINNA